MFQTFFCYEKAQSLPALQKCVRVRKTKNGDSGGGSIRAAAGGRMVAVFGRDEGVCRQGTYSPQENSSEFFRPRGERIEPKRIILLCVYYGVCLDIVLQ